MTNEELVARIKSGNNELMGELYTNNRGIIFKIAKKICNDNYDDLEDAMQNAYFGLVTAVENFDCNLQYKFITYATYHIRQSILRGRCTSLHISEHLMARTAYILKVKYALAQQYGRTPTLKEISRRTNLSINQIRKALCAAAPIKSIYEPLGDDITISDTIQDQSIDFENEIADADERRFVHAVVKELPEREKQAIKLYYFHRLPYKYVAEKLGVSYSYARELVRNGIKRLQKPDIKRKFLGDTLDSVTPFYQHRGVQAFNNTWTSSTEQSVIEREYYRDILTI